MSEPSDLHLPVTAIVFDNDGVLVDSNDSVARAWTAWAERRGLDPDEVIWFAHGHRSEDTVVHYCPPAEWAEAGAEIEHLEIDDAGSVAPVAGAVALAGSLPRDRWGVVTSGSVPLSGARLRAAGIPQPPFVITAEQVTRGKPDPEGYRLAIARLGVPAAEVAVLEDSPSGIRAALDAAAGVVIGVGEMALETGAMLVVRDLAALAWTGDGLRVAAAGRLR